MRLTYAKCAELLGNRERKKLAGNTYLTRSHNVDGATSYAVTFHSTTILRLYADGRVTVSSGGYRTVTTKGRLNEYGPVDVWQKSHKWYMSFAGVEMLFQDYLSFHTDSDGRATSVDETAAMTNEPEEVNLVRAFCAGECPAGVVTDWRKENGVLPV